MKKVKYKFYVTLLDAFQQYLDAPKTYHKFYTSDNPSMSEEDFCQKQFCSLIDRINRVPFESSAINKGTAFNEVIDSMIMGKSSEKINVEKVFLGEEVSDLRVTYKEETFLFDLKICESISEICKEGLLQQLVEGILPTKNGDVLLYGYVDAVLPFSAVDIKTTKRYNAFKFKDNWQHRAYPFCLNQNGVLIKQFDYVVTNFKEVHIETYMYRHEQFMNELTAHCTHFIDFLEHNRDKITDKKIFGLDE